MRIGNTTEREAPWKLEFSLDRLKPRNWKRPYLVYLHLVLKLLPWCVLLFGAPGVSYIGKSEGYLMATMKTEINAACFISLILSSILGLTSVYLNLYLFVQVRYYRQWTMSKFIASWAYNFFVRIEFLDDESSGNNFRNTYYDNRAKY
ncbi:hypothetical protein CAEBREN_20037 [Caenorhabditis brenneri]|uniref:Uncharacterized protein n=1 Tax=Caenorhabditis brenneri TaxID=135651 RepID=G0P4C0_CAEBE|nr:hypothetical protein CAEBREN_20037 [Caenorhabditis brenneri]